MKFTTLAFAALAGMTSAQGNAGIKMHVVTVGVNNTQKFAPEKLTANPGEVVQFQFPYGNHTVTQSTFDKPCEPIGQTGNITGFHSGFQPAAASQAMGMTSTYSIMINDTKPVWVYCAQAKHCEAGMVMVINENPSAPDKSLDAFKKLAAGVASTVVPGGGSATGANGAGASGGAAAGADNANGGAAAGAAGIVSVPSSLGFLAALASVFLL